LDVWAARLQRAPRTHNPVHRQRLQQIAQTTDPDLWRHRLRQAIAAKDLRSLYDMAASARLTDLHVRALVLLGAALETAGDQEGAITFLRKAQWHHPHHFSLNYNLASYLGNSIIVGKQTHRSWAEVTGFFRAALAVRPNSAAALCGLGSSLSACARSRSGTVE